MNTLFIPKQPRISPLLALAATLFLGGLAILSAANFSAENRKAASLGKIPKWILTSSTTAGKVTTFRQDAPWISFAQHQLSGNSGVNLYGGSYLAKADGTLKIRVLNSTEMASTPERMRREAAYRALLTKMTRWSVRDEVLVLSDGTDQNQLTFTAAPISP